MAEEENVNSEQENADSERFNSMLSAAKKQVGSDGGSSNLTQSQIEAMLAVNDDDDDEEEEDDEKESGNDEGDSSGEEGEEGPEQSEGSEGGKKKKKAKKSKKEKKPKVKKERKPVNKVLLSRILTVVGVLVAGAAGFVMALVIHGDLIKSSDEQFAIKCANALNNRLQISQINTKLSVYKAYVRNGASADVCMLYAVTSFGGNDKTDMYRVVVSHDDPNTINLYYTLDENSADYQRLLNSDKGEDRVQASLLKTYSDEIYLCDAEIRSGPTDWKRVDSVVINNNITSSQK